MNKYNVVVGWERGGTSALMLALRQCGIPILGHKYCRKVQSVDGYGNHIIIRDLGSFEAIHEEQRMKNPTGFWEIESICTKEGIQKKHADMGMNGDVVKISVEILPLSGPAMINKAIIIIRDPLKVLSSMLNIGMIRTKKQDTGVRMMALAMIYNMVASIKWLTKYKIPYHIVVYENLLKDPNKEMMLICEFLDRGDYRYAKETIITNLDRNEPIKSELEEVKSLIKLYNDIKNKQILDYNLNKIRESLDKLKGLYLIKDEKI